jgi:hypothetical protein
MNAYGIPLFTQLGLGDLDFCRAQRAARIQDVQARAAGSH